jgi:MFS family permease
MLERKEKIILYSSDLWYFSAGMLGPLFAVFAEKVGGDVLEISWAWATYLIISGVLIIVIGKISDKFNNKEKLLVLGYFLNTIFTFSYLLVSNATHLFIVEAGLGLASALAWPTGDALYAKYENKNSDGYQWGLFTGGEFIVGGLGLIVGGLIVSHFSFTALFIVMGSVQLIATIYQTQILLKKN